MTTEIAIKDPQSTVPSIFQSEAEFTFSLRVAKMLSHCDMLPKHFHGKNGDGDRALANCMVALDFARSVNASPFMVMKEIYEVYGNYGVTSKLMIALFNQSGKFGPLQYKYVGDIKTKDNNAGCIAYATHIRTNTTLDGPCVDWEMVKNEGWLSKKGSKWQTMPAVMFRYRAATLFIRSYAPEIMFGMSTTDELIDMQPDEESGMYITPPPENRPAMPDMSKPPAINDATEQKPNDEKTSPPPETPKSKSSPQRSERNPIAYNGPPAGVGLDGKPLSRGIDDTQKTQERNTKSNATKYTPPPNAQTLTFDGLIDEFVEDVVASACKRIGSPYPLRDKNNQSILKRIADECMKIVTATSAEDGF